MCHRNRAVNFHLMTLTVNNNFSNEFSRETFVNNDRVFEKFCDVSIKVLDKHAPIKKRYKRSNQIPFVTKGLSKVIMKRSELRNAYLKKTKLRQTECFIKSITYRSTYPFEEKLKPIIMQT